MFKPAVLNILIKSIHFRLICGPVRFCSIASASSRYRPIDFLSSILFSVGRILLAHRLPLHHSIPGYIKIFIATPFHPWFFSLKSKVFLDCKIMCMSLSDTVAPSIANCIELYNQSDVIEGQKFSMSNWTNKLCFYPCSLHTSQVHSMYFSIGWFL